jgi:hypothetical protein
LLLTEEADISATAVVKVVGRVSEGNRAGIGTVLKMSFLSSLFGPGSDLLSRVRIRTDRGPSSGLSALLSAVHGSQKSKSSFSSLCRAVFLHHSKAISPSHWRYLPSSQQHLAIADTTDKGFPHGLPAEWEDRKPGDRAVFLPTRLRMSQSTS